MRGFHGAGPKAPSSAIRPRDPGLPRTQEWNPEAFVLRFCPPGPAEFSAGLRVCGEGQTVRGWAAALTATAPGRTWDQYCRGCSLIAAQGSMKRSRVPNTHSLFILASFWKNLQPCLLSESHWGSGDKPPSRVWRFTVSPGPGVELQRLLCAAAASASPPPPPAPSPPREELEPNGKAPLGSLCPESQGWRVSAVVAPRGPGRARPMNGQLNQAFLY